MRIEIRYDEELDAMVFEVTGIAGAAELSELAARVLSEPRFRPNMNQLLDLTRGGVDVAAEELTDVFQAWLAKRSEIGESGYCLAVAAERPVDFGQARMYQALMEEMPQNFRVFRGLETARAWLLEMRDPA